MKSIRSYVREVLLESGRSGKRLRVPPRMPPHVPMINFSDRVDVGTRAENLVRIMADQDLVLRHRGPGPGADVETIAGGLRTVIPNPGRGVEVKSINTFTQTSCTVQIEITQADARRILRQRPARRAQERDLHNHALFYFNRRTVLVFNRGPLDPSFIILGGTWNNRELEVVNRRNRRTARELFESALEGGRPKISVRFRKRTARNKMIVTAGVGPRLTPTFGMANVYECIMRGISPQWVMDHYVMIEAGDDSVWRTPSSRDRRRSRTNRRR